MDDIPWHYVAMIFIVFVSWLYQRVQEMSAARRLRGAQKKAAAEAGSTPSRSPQRHRVGIASRASS